MSLCVFLSYKGVCLPLCKFYQTSNQDNVPNYFQEKNIGIKISDNFGH